MESFLSISDLMLLPSETESFGLVALEGMACGVPVVASRTGGLVELVEQNKTGQLHPVGDTEAMARAALEILAPANLEKYRRAARRRAVETFSADHVIPLYEQFYEEVLNRTD